MSAAIHNSNSTSPNNNNNGTVAPRLHPEMPFLARMHWKADNSTSVCSNCYKSFWIFRRRHHCRQCGELVCWACSKNRLATFIPGCEAVGFVRVCNLCNLKRQAPDFSWEFELAGYFGHAVARRGAQLMFNERHSWNRRQAMVSSVSVTVHHFRNEDEDDVEYSSSGRAEIGKPSAARPAKSQAAFWLRATTESQGHLASPRKSAQGAAAAGGGESVLELGECPICQFELSEPAGVEDYVLPRNVNPSRSLGTDPDAIVTINQCGHNFHAACVGKWLQDHTTCPMCRENAFKGLKK